MKLYDANIHCNNNQLSSWWSAARARWFSTSLWRSSHWETWWWCSIKHNMIRLLFVFINVTYITKIEIIKT
jgi:hypothetical protein